MKKALITGITGQDGAYLAEFLLAKGYRVYGIKRRSSMFNTQRIDHLYQDPQDRDIKLKLYHGDLTDSTNLIRIIQEVRPDEIYNLGAMSHVKVSFDSPIYTGNVNALGTLRLLESIRILEMSDKVRFFQASSSEMYGLAQETPQNESTPFYPRSPYAVAKLYAHWITINYREAYNMFAVNGILFNHESPIRGETFVTRKIIRGICRIVMGLDKHLYLGNLAATRDWGHAKDYMEAVWLMLQQDEPDDFVVATGVSCSVKEFVKRSFKCLGIELKFRGEGINEIGLVVQCTDKDYQLPIGQVVIRVDPRHFRPTEVYSLTGDHSKIRSKLGWSPTRSLETLVKEMVIADLDLLKREGYTKKDGPTPIITAVDE